MQLFELAVEAKLLTVPFLFERIREMAGIDSGLKEQQWQQLFEASRTDAYNLTRLQIGIVQAVESCCYEQHYVRTQPEDLAQLMTELYQTVKKTAHTPVTTYEDVHKVFEGTGEATNPLFSSIAHEFSRFAFAGVFYTCLNLQHTADVRAGRFKNLPAKYSTFDHEYALFRNSSNLKEKQNRTSRAYLRKYFNL